MRGMSAKKEPDWARPIVKENLSERAYRSLREALMRGQLRPGHRLLLRPTSVRFGISATPMREALLRLVSEKALALDARGTVAVPKLTLEQLLEIRTIRTDLEGRAAAAAAQLVTDSDIDALAAIHAQMAKSHQLGKYEKAIDLNTEFHLRLCRLGRLPVLYDIVEGLWVRCGPILSHLYDGGLQEDWDAHTHLRVLAALRARDPDAARQAICEDIVNGGQGLLAHVTAAAEAGETEADKGA